MQAMTVRELLKIAEESFRAKGLEDASTEAEILLCHFLKKDRIYLYAYGRQPLDEDSCQLFFDLLEKRIAGAPLQYVTGTAEFMGISLQVNSSVLIPRQDTELLAETALAELAGRHKRIGSKSVLDLCTGSGALAISIAKLADKVHVTATDISREALSVARKNAAACNLSKPIRFFRGDLFAALPFGSLFDVIVTNPPYIPTAVIRTLEAKVRDYEPWAALDGGKDGLVFIRRILDEAPLYLKPGGVLLMEIGYDQAKSVAALAGVKGGPYIEGRILKDLNKNDRVLVARVK